MIFLKQTPHIKLLASLIASPRLCLVPSNIQPNGHAKPNQVQNKKERNKKRGGRGKGEPQCAAINYSPPKSSRSGITFHFLPDCTSFIQRKTARLQTQKSNSKFSSKNEQTKYVRFLTKSILPNRRTKISPTYLNWTFL